MGGRTNPAVIKRCVHLLAKAFREGISPNRARSPLNSTSALLVAATKRNYL